MTVRSLSRSSLVKRLRYGDEPGSSGGRAQWPGVGESSPGREREHLPMGKAALIGATSLASHRILGSPAGKSPFARLTEVSFPTLKAVQECAALPGAQKTLAHAVEISTGGTYAADENYQRPVTLKAKYDPRNFFR